MLDTQEAEKILQDSGFEVIKTSDESYPAMNNVYLGNKVVWDKLILGMKTIKAMKSHMDQIPHFKWICQILNKYDLKMQILEVDTKAGKRTAYGFKFDRIYENQEKYQRLNKALSAFFYLVSVYMGPLLEPFEANDRKLRRR